MEDFCFASLKMPEKKKNYAQQVLGIAIAVLGLWQNL